MNMRYWGTVIFATLFSWHNSRWRKATGARNPDGSCTTSSVWQQLVLPGETKNCSHAAMPVVICCGTTGRETWTRKCLQCFDVLSILSLTLLLANVTGSRARGWNFRFAGSQAISFQDFGFWLAGTCLVGQGGEVCWVNFFPDMSGALTASPPLLHRFNALVVLGYLVKILRGRDLDVKFKAKFDLGVINGRV